MKTRTLILLCLALPVSPTFADGLARNAGRAVGEFGVGVGEVVGRGVARSVADLQPEWITIEPRPKEDCLAASGGELNNTYLRCRNGRQQQARAG